MAGDSKPRALTRAWFHGWCQCGSTALQLVDAWPQMPFTVCADCGHIAPHIFCTDYALHDTENGRHYLSYRSMEWPYYLTPKAEAPHVLRQIWARIRARSAAGGIPE